MARGCDVALRPCLHDPGVAAQCGSGDDAELPSGSNG